MGTIQRLGTLVAALFLCVGCGNACDYTTEHAICVSVGQHNAPKSPEIGNITYEVFRDLGFLEGSLKALAAVEGTRAEFTDAEDIWCGPIRARSCVYGSTKRIVIPDACDDGQCTILGNFRHELGHIVLWYAWDLTNSNKQHHKTMCETGFEPAACYWDF